MGAFEYELDVSLIPQDSAIVKVMFKQELLRTIDVVGEAPSVDSSNDMGNTGTNETSSDDSPDSGVGVVSWGAAMAYWAVVGLMASLV